ncbi:hypothetical protein NMG60_11026785 [Bertholletia excelsa]
MKKMFDRENLRSNSGCSPSPVSGAGENGSFPPPSPQRNRLHFSSQKTDTCFYCQKRGHWVKDCPEKSPKSETSLPATPVSTALRFSLCPRCCTNIALRISRSAANPGRKYYKCACGFFKWCDADDNDIVEVDTPMCKCGAGKCSVYQELSGPKAGCKFFVCPIKKGQGACSFSLPLEAATRHLDGNTSSSLSTLTNNHDMSPSDCEPVEEGQTSCQGTETEFEPSITDPLVNTETHTALRASNERLQTLRRELSQVKNMLCKIEEGLSSSEMENKEIGDRLDQNSEEKPGKRIEDAKLARDFQTTLQEFQKVQQLASERESTYSVFALPSSKTTTSSSGEYSATTSDQENQPFLMEQKRQELPLLGNEIAFNEAIMEEREQGIKDIQDQIGQANEIFKDLALLVHEQGVIMDDIQSNIEASSDATTQARVQLSKASKSVKSKCSWCWWVLAVVVVVLVIILLVLII